MSANDLTLRIIHSKVDKDRLVYLSADMADLISRYLIILKDRFQCDSRWLFPGKDPLKHLSNTSVDKKFNALWSRTSFAKTSDKKPTVHSLRHSFVVKRMNLSSSFQRDEVLSFARFQVLEIAIPLAV